MERQMRKAFFVLAALQLVNGDPIPSISSPPVANLNAKSIPLTALNQLNLQAQGANANGQNGGNNPPAIVILVAAPCQPQENAVEGKSDNPLFNGPRIVPINLQELLVRNQIINSINQQLAHEEAQTYAEKGGDLLSGGLLGSGQVGSILGGSGISGESGSNLFSGGTLLGGGSLGNGLLANLMNTGSTSGNGIFGIPLNGLNLNNLGSNGILGIFTGSNTGPNFLSNLLPNKGSGTGLFGTNFLSGLGGTTGTNPITTLLGNLGSGIPMLTTNTGGLAGILASLGLGGGIPAGPIGGIPGFLANLGIGNTMGNTNMFGVSTVSGLLGVLSNILSGNKGRYMEGNFKRYYARELNEKADLDKFPWIVNIFIDGVSVAKGVLVSDQHVLTTAAPFVSISGSKLLVALGQNDRCSANPNSVNMTVSQILKNPLFNPETRAHDLALLKLSNNVMIGKDLLPACLPSLLIPNILALKEATVASYGGSSSSGPSCRLKEVVFPLQPLEACIKSVSEPRMVTEDKTCMDVGESKEMCGALPGTAVQHLAKDGSYELIGILSHTKTCGSTDSSLFVRIYDHLPWILDNTAGSQMCIKI